VSAARARIGLALALGRLALGLVLLVAAAEWRLPILNLILVSYDPDQFFTVMAALLRANRDGLLSQHVLGRSEARLSRVVPRPRG
jgi:hypothetical protein